MVFTYTKRKILVGGPAGGDGGKGASVVLLRKITMEEEFPKTLLDFRYQRHFKASKGGIWPK